MSKANYLMQEKYLVWRINEERNIIEKAKERLANYENQLDDLRIEFADSEHCAALEKNVAGQEARK